VSHHVSLLNVAARILTALTSLGPRLTLVECGSVLSLCN